MKCKRLVISIVFFGMCGSVMAQEAGAFRKAGYDDSTLGAAGPYTLMPFNRLVRSAGKVLTFGDPNLENHALDFSVLPDGRHVAVEDRYGIAVVDAGTREIVHRWTYRDHD